MHAVPQAPLAAAAVATKNGRALTRARLWRWARWTIHLCLAVLGCVAIGLLVNHAGGWRRLGSTLGELGLAIVLAFIFEGARIASDAWRTQILYRMSGVTVPARRALYVQLASYPFALLLPAGGAAGEGFKASMLAREAGAPIAVAVATANQSLVLVAGFVISIPCVLAAASIWGLTGLTVAISIQAVTSLVMGVAVYFVARRRALASIAQRVSARAGEVAGDYQIAIRKLPLLPMKPLGAALVSRLAQLCELGILGAAAGGAIGFLPAFLALGVQLVGSAAGDLVPAQIGATDTAFALAAQPLGVDLAHALAIPVAMHTIQLVWALVGLVGLRTGQSGRN